MRHARIRWIAVAALATAAVFAAGRPGAAAEETRVMRQGFPLTGPPLRLANLAGRIDVLPGPGKDVTVEATIHAEGASRAETAKLLSEMKWVEGRDKKGRPEWALSYSLDHYHSFHYPRPDQRENGGFWSMFFDWNQSVTTYRGERVKIVSHRSSSAPTLYAQVRVYMPAGATLAVKNAVGLVQGGELTGNLEIDTGSGDVRLAGLAGSLTIDTGSGDVKVGTVRGQSSIDTGSGDVVVAKLIGNGSVNTGSGDVMVESLSAGKLAVDTGSGDVAVKNGVVSSLAADTGSGDVHVLGVELEDLAADTGSGDVTIQSSLAKARKIVVETGSGDISIAAGPGAAFDLDSDHGSGDLHVGYADATLKRSGKKVVGARRGNGQTHIHLETGSGDASISPKA